MRASVGDAANVVRVGVLGNLTSWRNRTNKDKSQPHTGTGPQLKPVHSTNKVQVESKPLQAQVRPATVSSSGDLLAGKKNSKKFKTPKAPWKIWQKRKETAVKTPRQGVVKKADSSSSSTPKQTEPQPPASKTTNPNSNSNPNTEPDKNHQGRSQDQNPKPSKPKNKGATASKAAKATGSNSQAQQKEAENPQDLADFLAENCKDELQLQKGVRPGRRRTRNKKQTGTSDFWK